MKFVPTGVQFTEGTANVHEERSHKGKQYRVSAKNGSSIFLLTKQQMEDLADALDDMLEHIEESESRWRTTRLDNAS